jgi:hypothetical protein
MEVVSRGAGFTNDFFKLNGGRSIKSKSILQMIELLLSTASSRIANQRSSKR